MERSPWFRDMPRRPERSEYADDKLFDYARHRQEWLRSHVADVQLPEAFEHLVHELETDTVIRPHPEVMVHTSSIYEPIGTMTDEGVYGFRASTVEPARDAELLGEQSISGRVFGFHHAAIRDERELYMYLARGEEPRKMFGGVHLPLWSVPVEGSVVVFREKELQQRQQELLQVMQHELGSMPHSTKARDGLYMQLIDVLGREPGDRATWLRAVAVAVELVGRSQYLTEELSDAMLDYISLRMRFEDPVDMHVGSYRVASSEGAVRSYMSGGEALFRAVEPRLCLIGESAAPLLACAFYDDNHVVQVPARAIRHIARSRQRTD